MATSLRPGPTTCGGGDSRLLWPKGLAVTTTAERDGSCIGIGLIGDAVVDDAVNVEPGGEGSEAVAWEPVMASGALVARRC